MRPYVIALLALCATPALSVPAGAQQSFYSHDNYTQYELLDPASHRFAITYFVTERRVGARVLLNQTRSGSAGSDISVFDPQTGRPLKFDYVSGDELAKDGTAGRFDPAEHYIRAHLARPVPEGGEGRVKILKTYRDEKSYYTEGGDIVFKRSLGIARNAIVLPKGYRLVSSNVASQMFTTADGRLKISFEHAHGYAADVTIRARKGAMFAGAREAAERAFDFSKTLYDLGPPEAHAFKVVHEYLETARAARVTLPRLGWTYTGDLVVTDVDHGARLAVSRSKKLPVATLTTPITAADQSARLRMTATVIDRAYRIDKGVLLWEGLVEQPRVTILLPTSWDVASISVPATIATQQDGRVAIHVYNGRAEPLKVTLRAAR
jgi:hypothetical protein